MTVETEVVLSEVGPVEYASAVQVLHAFASPEFARLNAHKVDSVHFLLFSDTKPRLGLIVGQSGTNLLSPFSAPFGGFCPAQDPLRIPPIEGAVSELERWARQRGVNRIMITPPPPVYAETFLTKLANVLFRARYQTRQMEINFHFELLRMDEHYAESIWRNARKNLNQSLKNGLTFQSCVTAEEKAAAYEVIHHNRLVRGKPLRMTLDQIETTSQVIPSSFFAVVNDQQVFVGAAIVFEVNRKIVQVIYWGDRPEFAHLKTMNFLSFHLFMHYREKGFQIVDVGYSTEDSVPNNGLCEFKESIGCSVQPKLVFEKSLA